MKLFTWWNKKPEPVVKSDVPAWTTVYVPSDIGWTKVYQPSALSQQVFAGHTVVSELVRMIPDLEKTVLCPVIVEDTFFGPVSLVNVVMHLNDDHKWTREQIADWLDTLDLNLRFPTP